MLRCLSEKIQILVEYNKKETLGPSVVKIKRGSRGEQWQWVDQAIARRYHHKMAVNRKLEAFVSWRLLFQTEEERRK
jgi:hypothetical protein